MWQQIMLSITGFCAGVIIAGGTVGLLIGLSVIPRYAGITHTAAHLLLFEDSMFLGALFGSWISLFSPDLPLGKPFLILYGFLSGIFLGGWILALAEIADILPIFSRRIRLSKGVPKIILSIALGKMLGALLFFFRRW